MKTKEEIKKIAEIQEMDPFECCYRYYYLISQGYDLLKEDISELKVLNAELKQLLGR